MVMIMITINDDDYEGKSTSSNQESMAVLKNEVLFSRYGIDFDKMHTYGASRALVVHFVR